jgi:hypothetical protein
VTDVPETLSRAAFARLLGNEKSYVTALAKSGRLVLTDDGKAIRVAESLALIQATESPPHQGVAERHAAARDAQVGQGAAVTPPAMPPAPHAAAQADDDADEPAPTNPHSMRRAKALADKEEALARKAERDEQLELGQLLRADEVDAGLAEAGTILRASLEALPYDLAPELAPITDEGELRAKLVEAIEVLLTELSRRFSVIAKREAA